MMKKDKNGVYHASFDCWQQFGGYTDFYDLMFDLGADMEKRKFPFRYNKEMYILWAWKGNYINLGAGAELGIYYGGEPHWKVDKSLAMTMSMSLKYKGKEIISYRDKTWWITGFNPKFLNVKAADLKVKYTVIFKNRDMLKAFKVTHGYKWSCNERLKTASYIF